MMFDVFMHKTIDGLMLKNLKIILDISPNDPFDVIFGKKKYLGRVRGFHLELVLLLFSSNIPLQN